jgi:putative copper export protein
VLATADTIVRTLHLLGAAVWAGGVVFLGVAATTARRTVPAHERITFFRLLGRRFLILAGVAMALLIATGIDMANERLPSWSDLWDTDYGERLQEKLGLVILVIGLTAFHSFVQGPALSRLREQALERPDDAELAALIRRKSARAGAVQAAILLVTIAILYAAARLVTG